MELVTSTHSLQGLEEAVEEQVPDDLSILKGRNTPYEKIGNHSQRSWEQDPTRGRREETTTTTSVDENVILLDRETTPISEQSWKDGATRYVIDCAQWLCLPFHSVCANCSSAGL